MKAIDLLLQDDAYLHNDVEVICAERVQKHLYHKPETLRLSLSLTRQAGKGWFKVCWAGKFGEVKVNGRREYATLNLRTLLSKRRIKIGNDFWAKVESV